MLAGVARQRVLSDISDKLKYLLARLQFNDVAELGKNVVVAKLPQQTPKP